MTRRLYDTKCYDLASLFLEDEPHLFTDANSIELAQEIQDCIESFIRDKNRNYEPPDPMAHVEFPFAENH